LLVSSGEAVCVQRKTNDCCVFEEQKAETNKKGVPAVGQPTLVCAIAATGTEQITKAPSNRKMFMPACD
jgi:hypothetical protein